MLYDPEFLHVLLIYLKTFKAGENFIVMRMLHPVVYVPTQLAEQLQNSFGVVLVSTKPPGHAAAFEPDLK